MSGPGLDVPPSDPRWPVLRLLRPPAFMLLVVGSLNIMFTLSFLVAAIIKIPVPNPLAQAGEPTMVVLPFTGSLVLGVAASLVCAGTSIWGALNAMRLRGYAMAIMGSLTATFPLSCTCVVGILVAPWMFFTLLRPEVRKSFSTT